jgi:RNA polymerase-binding transcription factor DksA
MIILRFLILALLICLQLNTAVATVNESDYIKDTVPVGNRELPVLLNKDTKKVEYCRDEDKEEWVAADKSTIDLQKQYDDRVSIRDERQMRQTQKDLDEMEEDSFKGWIYDRPK